MKIYVVTAGDYYSEYRVLAATFDEEVAEEVRKRYNKYTYENVEVTEIEEGVPKIFFQNSWNISFDRKGGISGITMNSPDMDAEPVEEMSPSKVDGCLRATVLAETIEEAIKIGMERAKEYLKNMEVCEND